MGRDGRRGRFSVRWEGVVTSANAAHSASSLVSRWRRQAHGNGLAHLRFSCRGAPVNSGGPPKTKEELDRERTAAAMAAALARREQLQGAAGAGGAAAAQQTVSTGFRCASSRRRKRPSSFIWCRLEQC